MSFSFFGWLRSQARQAVLGGVADAMDELAADPQPADLTAFQARLSAAAKSLALPAATTPATAITPAEAEEPAKKGRGK